MFIFFLFDLIKLRLIQKYWFFSVLFRHAAYLVNQINEIYVCAIDFTKFSHCLQTYNCKQKVHTNMCYFDYISVFMHFKLLIYLCIGKVPCTSDMYTVWEKKRATRLPCSGFNGILSFKVDIRVRFMILKKYWFLW